MKTLGWWGKNDFWVWKYRKYGYKMILIWPTITLPTYPKYCLGLSKGVLLVTYTSKKVIFSADVTFFKSSLYSSPSPSSFVYLLHLFFLDHLLLWHHFLHLVRGILHLLVCYLTLLYILLCYWRSCSPTLLLIWPLHYNCHLLLFVFQILTCLLLLQSQPFAQVQCPLYFFLTIFIYPLLFVKVSVHSLSTPFLTFFNNDHLHPTYQSFSLSLATESILKSHVETISLPPWKIVMDLEYEALVKHDTSMLVPQLTQVNIITCIWCFLSSTTWMT